VTPQPTTPLFLQALGLVGATLVAVFVAAIVVSLNIPPPAPDIYRVSDVAQALRTGKGGPTPEGRSLQLRVLDQPPAGISFGRRHTDFRAGIARR
jgi:hypothetical protein